MCKKVFISIHVFVFCRLHTISDSFMTSIHQIDINPYQPGVLVSGSPGWLKWNQHHETHDISIGSCGFTKSQAANQSGICTFLSPDKLFCVYTNGDLVTTSLQ